MSVLSDLQTAKAGIAAVLAEVCASPKPTYSVGGQNVDWAGYVVTLTNQMEKLNELISQEGVSDGQPFEYRSQAVS